MANNQRRLEDLLDELFDLIDNAGTVPVIGALMGGKVLVDGEAARQIIDDIRDVMPEEIDEARAVLDDETRIINDAHAEADTIIKAAQLKADALVNQSEIVRTATARANEIDKAGQDKYINYVTAAYDYVDDLLKASDNAYANQLGDIRKMRQDIKDNRRKELKNI